MTRRKKLTEEEEAERKAFDRKYRKLKVSNCLTSLRQQPYVPVPIDYIIPHFTTHVKYVFSERRLLPTGSRQEKVDYVNQAKMDFIKKEFKDLLRVFENGNGEWTICKNRFNTVSFRLLLSVRNQSQLYPFRRASPKQIKMIREGDPELDKPRGKNEGTPKKTKKNVSKKKERQLGATTNNSINHNSNEEEEFAAVSEPFNFQIKTESIPPVSTYDSTIIKIEPEEEEESNWEIYDSVPVIDETNCTSPLTPTNQPTSTKHSSSDEDDEDLSLKPMKQTQSVIRPRRSLNRIDSASDSEKEQKIVKEGKLLQEKMWGKRKTRKLRVQYAELVLKQLSYDPVEVQSIVPMVTRQLGWDVFPFGAKVLGRYLHPKEWDSKTNSTNSTEWDQLKEAFICKYFREALRISESPTGKWICCKNALSHLDSKAYLKIFYNITI